VSDCPNCRKVAGDERTKIAAFIRHVALTVAVERGQLASTVAATLKILADRIMRNDHGGTA
jgi:hypothetical protein